MALRIDTFSNVKGGNAFFKAVGHPAIAGRTSAFVARFGAGPVAVYDPAGHAAAFGELCDLSDIDLAGVYVQDLDDLGRQVIGRGTQPVTDLKGSGARTVLVASFDAERAIDHIRHLIPDRAQVISLDDLRLPDEFLTNRRRYLDPLNFAVNFAFFRDSDGHHTRLVTANYWSRYGAEAPRLWCCLFGENGAVLADWRQDVAGDGASIAIDSAELRRRFDLGPFTGQLFVHVIGAAGHDVVKYALDTYGDTESALSCTHDANAWPADLYAGLPAPEDDATVILWVQNSHPAPIPRGGVGLNLMGHSEIRWLDREIPAFGTYALDTRELLPDARWPQQIEVQAGKHFVRPRYEVIARSGRRRIAHVNVERTDLKSNPRIRELANLMGKGYLLPAPVAPPDRFRSIALPTPMATCQENLPLAARVYDSRGREIAVRRFGKLARTHEIELEAGQLLQEVGATLDGDWGHMELAYDFSEGGEADGWLHALFRYEDKASGHAAETSFGAHMFNTVLTYRGEPQSYGGPPPGLSTRLFLRLGPGRYETFCHLIYPASTPWHEHSRTALILYNPGGEELATRDVTIPCGGSLFWRAADMFENDALRQASDGGYVIVRDPTCRLFGYQGLFNADSSFSLDHMFGF
jgi:hypothetical protein